MTARRFLSSVLILFAVAPVFADQVHLKNGRVLEGTIQEETKDSLVVKTTSGATATIPLANVKKIERGATAADDADTKLAALDPDDLMGHHELAQWCESKKLAAKAKAIYTKVLERWPHDATSRRALGYVRHEGKWMTRQEYMRGLGLVESDGGESWVTPEQAEKRARLAEAKGQRRDVEKALRMAATTGGKKSLADLRAFDDLAAVPVLVAKSRSTSVATRRVAVAELARRKAQEAELALARIAVEDSKRSLRESALEGLDGLGSTSRAKKYFLKSVTRKNQFQRVHAVQAVGAYPADNAVPRLIQVLREATSNFGKANISVTTQRAYIQDFELSSGGTGNIVAEVADPIIGGFTEGVTLEMKVTLWERRSVVTALRRVTGQKFGAKPADWQRWWNKRQK